MIGRVLERVIPELLGDLEILRGHRFDLVVVIETEADAFLGMDAAADAVKHFALGKMVEEIHLLDEMHRMMQRHDDDGHAEPGLLQLRRDVRSDLKRRAAARRIAVEMMLGKEHAFEAEPVGFERLLNDGVDDVLVLCRVPGAGEVDDREFHYSSGVTTVSGMGAL